MELNHVQLIFTFTLTGDIPDPFALYSCRIPFTDAFRASVQCHRGECRRCRPECAFSATFAQEISSDPEAVRRHQKPPLPFVFQMPTLPPLPNRGSSHECALTLFGSAIQHLDGYLAAMRLYLSRLPAQLKRVEALSPGGGRTVIAVGDAPADHHALPLLSPFDPLLSGPLRPDRVTVEFLTPLKLLQEGRALTELSFSHFARALMRRASSMAYYYGGIELPLDYRTLAARSESISVLVAGCHFAHWGGRLSGMVGKVTFMGSLDEFHLLLLMGSVMHLGKGASFGLGRFRLS